MSKRGKEIIALIGTSMILSGMMIGCAGCKSGLNTPIKESVTQTEVIDSENKIESMDELALNQVIPTPTQNVSIPEKEVQDEGIKEEFESLDTKTNITFKDGIYGFTEKFINSVSSYEYFEGATQKEINDFLQELAPVIDGLSGKDVDVVLSIYEGNLHAQNQKKAEASKPTPTPEVKEPEAEKPTEQKPVATPTPVIKEPANENDYSWFDDLIVNEDGTRTSSDGTFTFDDPDSFGGGPHTELPEGFLGFNSGGQTKPVATPTPVVKDEVGVFDGGFDDLIINEDGTRTSPDGSFTFDAPIGGGPHTEISQEDIDAFINKNN